MAARIEAPAVRLTLLDTVILPPVTTPPGGRRAAWFGSLSGLAQDARSGPQFLADFVLIPCREPCPGKGIDRPWANRAIAKE